MTSVIILGSHYILTTFSSYQSGLLSVRSIYLISCLIYLYTSHRSLHHIFSTSSSLIISFLQYYYVYHIFIPLTGFRYLYLFLLFLILSDSFPSPVMVVVVIALVWDIWCLRLFGSVWYTVCKWCHHFSIYRVKLSKSI